VRHTGERSNKSITTITKKLPISIKNATIPAAFEVRSASTWCTQIVFEVMVFTVLYFPALAEFFSGSGKQL